MYKGIENDLVYLLDMLEHIGKASRYMESIEDADAFYRVNDQLNYTAVLGLLMQIGENATKTSDELKQKHPAVDWIKIKAFRNRIAHDYTGLNVYMVFMIATCDLPVLKDALVRIINDELQAGTFSRDELQAAADSYMYRHVPFSLLIPCSKKN